MSIWISRAPWRGRSSRPARYYPNDRCPICNEAIVSDVVAAGGEIVLYEPRSREDKVAACAEHGHGPWNVQTIAWLESRDREGGEEPINPSGPKRR